MIGPHENKALWDYGWYSIGLEDCRQVNSELYWSQTEVQNVWKVMFSLEPKGALFGV